MELSDFDFNDGPLILDLCGGSGSWSQPYKDRGYNVVVVSLPDYDARLWPSETARYARLPNEFNDIREVKDVHGILAAPPCTCFATSGSRIHRSDGDMTDTLSVVDACLRLIWVLKPQWWALENPVSKLPKWLGDPVYKFNPCDFGDTYTKETWLWGNFHVPELNWTPPTEQLENKVRDPAKRAVTSKMFAEAFYRANP